MNKVQRKTLERRGWKIGGAGDFLGLSPEEDALVTLKLALGSAVRNRRQKAHLTQADLAKRLGSSQSRVAKMEGGDPSVSIDLLVRALLAVGVKPKRLVHAFG